MIVLLGGVVLLANVQKQQETRSRAGVNSVQVQCGQQFPPVVELAYSFTNTESYPVDIVASFSQSETDPISEITNIPPGESRNGILNTEKGAVPAGKLTIDWFPSDENSTEPGGFEEKTFTALTCSTSPTSNPTANPSVTLDPTVTLNDPTGTVTPSITTTLSPTVTQVPTVTRVPTVTGISLSGTVTPSAGPTAPPSAAKLATDLNDDGKVNQVDYNLFIREISTQPGN